jgi:hypothetical protein
VATATFASQSEVVHRSSLCRLLGRRAEVDQLILLGTAILDTISFDEFQVAFPFASDWEIARVATNGDWEVHTASCYPDRLPFFLSAEETMKRAQIVLGVLVVLLLVSVVWMGQRQQMFPGLVPDLPARVQQDLANEKKRFLPQNSVDIAMAMKMVTHDPPSLLAPPEPQLPLLVYPPSEETLARLSGV